jgi:hypothetical protein
MVRTAPPASVGILYLDDPSDIFLIRHCISFWPISCDTNAKRDERSKI